MKTFCLAAVIAFCMLLCKTRIKAQSTQTKPDQVALIKPLIGTFKCEMGKDTVILWDFRPFGKGYELYYTFKAKGKTYYEMQETFGDMIQKRIDGLFCH